jgi:MtN3 and saliva related transmembrane protein
MLSNSAKFFIRQNRSRYPTLVSTGGAAMSGTAVTTTIGIVAAVCTTLSFVPQIVKIRRQGARDLSYGMLCLYLLGLSLWLTYGIRIGAPEVIGANIVAGALVAFALLLKWRSELSGSLETVAADEQSHGDHTRHSTSR